MLGLSQMVTFLTRLDNNPDVFLTNRPSLVNSCEPVPGISDYDAAVYVHSDIMPKDIDLSRGRLTSGASW